MAFTTIVGRNPSPRIGRNPSPRMQPTWRPLALTEASTTDTNGILVSASDDGDGLFTFTVDDSTIVTDPADGATMLFRLRDVVGADVGSINPTICIGMTISGTIPSSSDLVVMHGLTTVGIGGVLIGYGIQFAAGQLNSRSFVNGVTVDTMVDASARGLGASLNFRPDASAGVKETETITGRCQYLNASGVRLTAIAPTITGLLESVDDLFFWVSVFRSATGGGNATIEFRPAYLPPFVTGTFAP